MMVVPMFSPSTMAAAMSYPMVPFAQHQRERHGRAGALHHHGEEDADDDEQDHRQQAHVAHAAQERQGFRRGGGTVNFR